jgi:hypothetical protein
MKEKKRETVRECILRADIKTVISLYCIVGLVWFLVYYSSHHPLTSDCWDLNFLVWCERYSPRHISRKTCLQVSQGHWPFLPLSTVGSCSNLDMLVILVSSSLWTVEIWIRDFDKEVFIVEQYIVNFQVCLVLFRSRKIYPLQFYDSFVCIAWHNGS